MTNVIPPPAIFGALSRSPKVERKAPAIGMSNGRLWKWQPRKKNCVAGFSGIVWPRSSRLFFCRLSSTAPRGAAERSRERECALSEVEGTLGLPVTFRDRSHGEIAPLFAFSRHV